MKKIKLFAFVALGSLLAISCVDDEADQFGGGDTSIIGFGNTSLAANYVTSPDTLTYNIPVNVIGGNQGIYPDAEVTVNYELATTGTATPAMFALGSNTGSVTIPAGSNVALIPISIYSEQLVIGEARTVVLNITSVTSQDDVILASNYDTVVLSLTGLCFSDLAGAYTVNYTSGSFPVTITEVAPGLYHSDTVMGWTHLTGYEMTFSDVCDTLSFVDWTFMGSNPMTGTGTVAENGNLVWTGITIAGVYENRNYTFVKN